MADQLKISDQLVALLRSGGNRELIADQLSRDYYAPLVNFFTRQGFTRDESRDLAQETFLRAVSGLDGFRGECTFKTWLLRIAGHVRSNAIRDRHAAKRYAPEVSLDEVMEDRVAVSAGPPSWRAEPPSPLDRLIDDERTRRLHEAIEELPPQMQRCLVMRIREQLKYEEIAAALGISTGTVKAHLSQARQRLKGSLGELGELANTVGL